MAPIASTSTSEKKWKGKAGRREREPRVRVSKDTSTSAKKEKYSGLSHKEKEFVHALRALFDPKGKQAATSRGSPGRNCDEPKGSGKSKATEKEPKKSNRRAVPVTVKGNGKTLSTKVQIPGVAGKGAEARLVKSAEKRLRKRLAEKQVSPSKAARSERRAELGNQYAKMRGDRALPKELNPSKVVPATLPRDGIRSGTKHKGKGWMPLTAITPLMHCELEVEQAFGGSAALNMLRAISNPAKGTKYSHYTWTGRPVQSSATSKRDYNIAVKDLNLNQSHSEKRGMSLRPKALRSKEEKKVDMTGKDSKDGGATSGLGKPDVKGKGKQPSKGKTIPSLPKKDKKVTRSQLRRKAKRALRAAESTVKTPVVKHQSDSLIPAMVSRMLPPTMAAKPKSLFDNVDETLTTISQGISRGEYSAKHGQDPQKIFEKVDMLLGLLLSMKGGG